MEVALQDDAVFVDQFYYPRDRALDQARELGVTRLRVNLMWKDALAPEQFDARRRPSRPRYDFRRYDDLVDAAAARGIRIHFTLASTRTPRFATSKPNVRNYAPNAAAYGQFASAVAGHFRGRVDRYSIWNEPNVYSWLSPNASAGKVYRGLYGAGYKAIKRADPDAKVLIGETSPFSNRKGITPPLRFLRSVLCVDARYRPLRGRGRCAPLRADGYAHHPYDFEHAPGHRFPGNDNVTMGTLGRLTSALDKAARSRALRTPSGGRLDVHLTEYGYFATGARRVPTDQARAQYLVEGFAIAQRNPRVRSNLQYELVHPPVNSSAFWWDSGLVHPDGVPDAAFAALAGWTRGIAAYGGVAAPGPALALPPRRS
jgi:hypothetical protein